MVQQTAGPLGEALRGSESLLGQFQLQDWSFVGYSGAGGGEMGGLTHFSAPGCLGQGVSGVSGSRPSWGGPEGSREPAGAV